MSETRVEEDKGQGVLEVAAEKLLGETKDKNQGSEASPEEVAEEKREDRSGIPLAGSRARGGLCGIRLPRCADVLLQYVLPPCAWVLSDVGDVVSDIVVAASHYRDGSYLYFALTLCFVFAPSLAIFLLALNNLIRDRLTTCAGKLLKLFIYSLAILTLSLWPVCSYLQMLYYGMKALCSRERSAEYVRAWKKVQDESLPAYYVIKAFLECAPQLALQLYIMLSNPPTQQNRLTVLVQIVSCTLSLISMAGKSIQFRKYIQEAEMVAYSDDRSSNCILYLWNAFLVLGDYLWWFCSIAARIVAIVMFASVFHAWVFLVCLAHALVMIVWIIYSQPKITVERFFVSLFVGIMYIFCFLEYKVDFGQTSLVAKCAFYYLVMVCQNTVLVLTAYFLNEAQEGFEKAVHRILLIVHYVATLVDLVFMVGYLLHSKRDRLLKGGSAQPTYTL